MRKTCTLQQKWDALDKLKSESTEEDFYRRFCQFFELMISQGVTAVGTFVDIDPQSRDRAIKAGVRAREHYADQLTVKFANQTLKGVIDPEARQWFDIGSEMVDIIGALPKRDEKDYGKGSEAFDIILSTAKRLNKMATNSMNRSNMKPKNCALKPLNTVCRAKLWPFTVFPSLLTLECIAAACTI